MDFLLLYEDKIVAVHVQQNLNVNFKNAIIKDVNLTKKTVFTFFNSKKKNEKLYKKFTCIKIICDKFMLTARTYLHHTYLYDAKCEANLTRDIESI